MAEIRERVDKLRSMEILQRLDRACGLTVRSNTVADLVTAYILDKFKGNVVHFATHAGLHRNFIIEIKSGKYPKTRDGHRFAEEDSRYAELAKALGLKGENKTAFIKLVSDYQSSITRFSRKSLDPEIEIAITGFRADVLRACPDIDPVSFESALTAFRSRLLAALSG